MKRLWWCLFALWMASLLGWPIQHAAAQSSTPTLDEFGQYVREALAASQRNDKIGLQEATNKLTAIDSLTLPNEASAKVDLRWLEVAVDVANPNFSDISARLSAILEVLTESRPATAADMSALAEIINNPPFDDTPPEEFIAAPPKPLGARPSFNSSCLIIPAIIVFLAIVGYVIITTRRGIIKNDTIESDEAISVPKAPIPRSSLQAIKQADEVAVEGDFRKAVRYLYLSTLLWLAERQVLAFDRTLTNYEVLAAVPPSSPLRDRLTPVVRTFDEVWYGFHEIDEHAFNRFRQQVTALREGRNAGE